MASEFHNRHETKLFFTSAAAEEETFQVARFTGEEAISRPYHFKIDLVSDDPDIDMDRMIGMPARLTIEKDGDRRHIHGVLKTFHLGDEAKSGRYYYHAELVPRLWLMSLSRQNQIYQNKSVPEIVREELLASQNKGATAGITGKDFEFRLTQQYVRREYVVQYAESDFNFISRLMEHEGLFYFFEQDQEKEKLVITDNNIHLTPIAQKPLLTYRPAAGVSSDGEYAVKDFSCMRQRIPGHLVLKDYNYRLPHLPLQAEAAVDPASHGMICNYGDHFKIPEEGQALAKIRSQEILARRTRYQGRSDCIHFQAADKFNLEDHFRAAFNQEYILAAVHHEGNQMLSGIDDQAADKLPETDYRNSFEAIGADVAYRPERVTPKPRLYGIMNAHVDSALLEDRAEIDEQGRYKVVMPFDISGPAGGKATRYIRMAQPYGGQGQGMHFPLRKNTEVIWTCIDGDPDRPIIIGAVPNPITPSVVNSENHTRNIIKTSHGSFLEFNDGRGNGAAPRSSPATPGGKLQPQQNHQNLSGDSLPPRPAPEASLPSASDLYYLEPQSEFSALASGNNTVRLARQQQQQPGDVTYAESDPSGGNDVWFRVNVPEYDVTRDAEDNVKSTYDSYMRIGKKPADETSLMAYEGNLDPDSPDKKPYVAPEPDSPDGWLDYTDGNHTSITRGNRKVMTGGDRTEVVNGTYNLTIAQGGMDVYDAQPFYNVAWHKSWGNTWTKFETQFLNEFTFTSGQSSNLYLGTKADATIGAAVNFDLGARINLGAVMQFDYVKGPVIDISETKETKANNSITLKVDAKKRNREWMKAVPLLVGAGATALGVHALTSYLSTMEWSKKKGNAWEGVAASLGPLTAGAILLVLYARKLEKEEQAANTTEIEMTEESIKINNKPKEKAGSETETVELKCGHSSIVLQANGTIKITGKKVLINGEERAWMGAKTLGLTSSGQGKTIIGGNRVSISSDSKTTVGSRGSMALEANVSASLGAPDTQNADIKREEAKTDRLLKVPEQKAGPKKASLKKPK